VSGDVSFLVLDHDRVTVSGLLDGNGPLDSAHELVLPVDSAVDDRDADTSTGEPTPSPLAIDSRRQRGHNALRARIIPPQAPGGELLVDVGHSRASPSC
jgi:hypothetical protein